MNKRIYSISVVYDKGLTIFVDDALYLEHAFSMMENEHIEKLLNGTRNYQGISGSIFDWKEGWTLGAISKKKQLEAQFGKNK